MKRALAMGLGALMVAGSAAPASAAAHIDFSGYYRVMYMSETNTSHTRESASFTDSYFQDRLNLDLTFSPTDEISVYWRLRGPGSYQRWGRGSKDDKSLYTHFIYGEIKQDWGTVLVGRISDDLDVYGLASLGYQPATVDIFTNTGPFDRADVLDGVRYSYAWDNGFGIMAQYGKLDNNGQSGGNINGGNGYWGLDEWENTDPNGKSDQDWDRYQLEATYNWDGGGAALGFFYDRNATYNGDGWGRRSKPGPGYRYYPENLAGYAVNKTESWGVNPAIMHSWGDFSMHFEGMAQWGKNYYLYAKDDGRKGEFSRNATGYGAYLDADYNYGPGNVTLAAWWVSGSDLNDTKDKSIANIVGGNFYPLLVAYNGANLNPGGNRYDDITGKDNLSAIGFANNAYYNYVAAGYNSFADTFGTRNPTTGFYDANKPFLNHDMLSLRATNGGVGDQAVTAGYIDNFNAIVGGDAGRQRTTSFNNGTDANHWAIALTGNHAFTDDISMHYGLAYLALNKPNYRVATSGTVDTAAALNWGGIGYTTQDKDLGFEVDLGFTFQLLDNLKFTSAFGYMFNGDAYKQLKGYNVVKGNGNTGNLLENGDSIRARWTDADDSYVWFNSLTFAF